jgi:hypothetical protein
MKRLGFVTLMTFTLLGSAFTQQKITLTPSKDNTLYESSDGSLSDGAGEYIFVGRVGSSGNGAIRRTLIRFDISGSVPSGATILDAKLTLNMSKSIAGPTIVNLKKVTADWGEGASNATANEGKGAPSTINDATWIHRFYNTSSWITPGGDFVSTVSASASVSGVGKYSWGSTAQMVADVQGWLNNPASNFGWILLGDESTPNTAKRFDSRQNTVAANMPSLQLTYGTSAAVGGNTSSPESLILAQNYPNPFNPSTVIRYEVKESGRVSLRVYNTLGGEVRRLVDGWESAGSHAAVFDANGLPTGLYCYKLSTASGEVAKKALFVK